MNDENLALEEMKAGQFDEEIEAENRETALTPAEIDLIQKSGTLSLMEDVIREIVEEARNNPLSLAQIEAAALVAMGLNDVEIATLVGVSRQSVNKWKNHNFFFMEEVKKNRAEVMESHKVRYRTMIPRAMDVMGEALDASDVRMRMRAATFILRSLKLE